MNTISKEEGALLETEHFLASVNSIIAGKGSLGIEQEDGIDFIEEMNEIMAALELEEGDEDGYGYVVGIRKYVKGAFDNKLMIKYIGNIAEYYGEECLDIECGVYTTEEIKSFDTAEDFLKTILV